MASSMLTKVTCLAMICLVLGIPLANAASSCPAVSLTLAPCDPYVRHQGPPLSPPEICCNAVKTLNGQSKTLQDRQDVCGCLKAIVGGSPDFNLPVVASLPKDCGVDLGFEISPNVDCSKVN